MWGGAESEGESSEEEGAERLMRAKADDVEASSSRKRHLEHSEGESVATSTTSYSTKCMYMCM